MKQMIGFLCLGLALPAALGQVSQFERFEQLARRARTVLDANPAEAAGL